MAAAGINLTNLLAGGVIAGGQAAATSRANRKVRDFNRKEALKARRFSASQSATVAQRGVVDLKKAGLNPILAAGGFGGGSAASGGSGASAPQQENTAVAAGMSAARLAQEMSNLKAVENKTNAERHGIELVNDGREPKAAAARALMRGVHNASGAIKGSVYDEFQKRRPGGKPIRIEPNYTNYKNAPKQGPKRPPAKYKAGSRGRHQK